MRALGEEVELPGRRARGAKARRVEAVVRAHVRAVLVVGVGGTIEAIAPARELEPLLDERGESHFQETPGMKQGFELRQSLGKLSSAVVDGARGTDEATMKRIGEILDRARKEVYSVLAES